MLWTIVTLASTGGQVAPKRPTRPTRPATAPPPAKTPAAAQPTAKSGAPHLRLHVQSDITMAPRSAVGGVTAGYSGPISVRGVVSPDGQMAALGGSSATLWDMTGLLVRIQPEEAKF